MQYEEKLRMRAAVEERQQRLQQGIDPELPKSLVILVKLDAQTVRMHELTHARFEPWCFECALGKGAAAPFHPARHQPSAQKSGDPDGPPPFE